MHDRRRRPRVQDGSFIGGIGLAPLLALLAVPACSDGPLTRPMARDRAAGAVCDYQARCQNIGPPPAPFTSRDDCLITWKSNIDGLWPPDRCTTIVQTGFDVCIAAIRNEACGNGSDFVNTLVNCSEANVCEAP